MNEMRDIWQNGRGKLDEDKLIAYLEGKLSPAEQREVEQWLHEESMEGDALEGLMPLSAEETRKSVSQLNQYLTSKTKAGKRKRKHMAGSNLWVIVAIVLILLIAVLGYVFMHFILKK